MISRTEIDHIKGLVNIESLMERYGIQLKPSGMNLKGLCPFHDERSPSFNVRPSSNTYHCFGCGESGDSLSFVQHKEGLTFTDSVVFLAELVGYEIKSNTQGEEDDGISKRRLFAVMEAAAHVFRANYQKLPQEHAAREELRKRKFEAENTDFLNNLGIGYAEEGWTKLYDFLLSMKFTREEILAAGLAGTSNASGRAYDLFRGRLTWEIRDIQGRVIGFGARRLYENDKGPKYLNSPDSPIYHKSSVLYGIDLARKSIRTDKRVYIVEGYTDVMAFNAAGIHNVLASCGTAFGDGHAAVLRRLMGDEGRFIFFFDGDAAGQNAARKTFELSAPIHSRAYVGIAEGGDPCDIRLKYGNAGLLAQVAEDKQVPLTRFVLQSELSKHDVKTPEGRADYLQAVRPLLAGIADFSMREDYKRQVALWSGTTLDVVNQVVGRAVVTASSPEPTVVMSDTDLYTRLQTDLLSLALQYPRRTVQGLNYKHWDTSLFSSDKQDLATQIWNNAMEDKVTTPAMYPDYESQIIHMLHTPFTFETLGMNDKERNQAIQRTARTLYRGLQEYHNVTKIANFSQQLNTAQGAGEGDGGLIEGLMARRAGISRRQVSHSKKP